MGARGAGATGRRRASQIDSRPHSSARGVGLNSAGYWDLVLGDGSHWADPEDPARKAAWDQWRDAILARWQWFGRRPAAWVTFDLPPLVDRARPWRKDMLDRWRAESGDRQIPLAELVYALKETAESERDAIAEDWRKGIVMAEGDAALLAELEIPPWFVDDELQLKGEQG